MKGKLVVGFLILATLVFFAFATWFFGVKTPLDQRFNLKRTAIPKELTGQTIADMKKVNILFPAALSNFVLQSTTPFQSNSTADSPFHGEGIYSNGEEGTIHFSADKLKADIAPTDALKAAFSRYQPDNVTTHFDAPAPFVVAQGKTTAFFWVNGGWLFSASSDNIDPESLLVFVNTYEY